MSVVRANRAGARENGEVFGNFQKNRTIFDIMYYYNCYIYIYMCFFLIKQLN